MNKRGLSPLIATLLLVVFSLVIGVVAMNLGKWHLADESSTNPSGVVEPSKGAIVIGIDVLTDPLKALQINYITDKIGLDEYLDREKEIVGKR